MILFAIKLLVGTKSSIFEINEYMKQFNYTNL